MPYFQASGACIYRYHIESAGLILKFIDMIIPFGNALKLFLFAPVNGIFRLAVRMIIRSCLHFNEDKLIAILEAAGTGLDRVVKTTVFLQNLDDFQGMNSVYAAYVGDRPPARSTVEVAKLPSGALVEIEAIAHV